MSKVYIAYGSNLNMEQMQARCPDAWFCGTGKLENWELLYRGGTRSGGVATIRRKKGKTVPVGLWFISEEDEKHLDVYEGFPWLYAKQNVFVQLDRGDKKVKGLVYIMTPKYCIPSYPSESYIKTILKGYVDCRLDMEVFEESLMNCCIEMRKERP